MPQTAERDPVAAAASVTDRAGLLRRNLYDPAQSELEARLTGIAAVLWEWLQMPAPANATATTAQETPQTSLLEAA